MVIGNGPRPKHQQLRDAIIAIAVPGEAIPSERDLMVRYGLSRGTVRKAIDDLVSDGLLRKVLGKGTYAVAPRLESNLHLASFSDDMRRRGLVPSTRLLSVTHETPPADIAKELALTEGEHVWRVRRVRMADGEPIALEDSSYPTRLLPELDRRDLTGSLYSLFGEAYGLWIDHADQTLWGEVADSTTARMLAAPVGAPLIAFARTSLSSSVPVERAFSYYRGDRYQLHMRLTRDLPGLNGPGL